MSSVPSRCPTKTQLFLNKFLPTHQFWFDVILRKDAGLLNLEMQCNGNIASGIVSSDKYVRGMTKCYFTTTSTGIWVIQALVHSSTIFSRSIRLSIGTLSHIELYNWITRHKLALACIVIESGDNKSRTGSRFLFRQNERNKFCLSIVIEVIAFGETCIVKLG